MNARSAILSDRFRHVLETELTGDDLGEYQTKTIRVRGPDYKVTIHVRGKNDTMLFLKFSTEAARTESVKKEDITEKIIEVVLDDFFRGGRQMDTMYITKKVSTTRTRECHTPRGIHKFLSDTIVGDYTLASITVMHDDGIVTAASSAVVHGKYGRYVTDFATYVDNEDMPIVEFTKNCKSAKTSISAIKRALTLVRPYEISLVTTELVNRSVLLDSSQPGFFTPRKGAESLHEELMNVTWMPENLRLTMDETEYEEMTKRWISTNP
jgi:hypothetical protein